jgi:hypothetical protein
MTPLVFYVPTNSPNKHDGDEFAREAAQFALMYPESRVHPIRHRKGQAERQARMQDISLICEGHADKGSKFDSLAVFCHGWSNGIQLGFKVSDDTIDDFCTAIAECCTPTCRIVLYCCSTAHDRDNDDREAIGPGTEGGFADELYKRLSDRGFNGHRVDAHFTPGHTTRNPYVVRFKGSYISPNYRGGEWLIDPKDDMWRKWRKALQGEMRFRFPFMTRREVQRVLLGLPEKPTPLPKMVKNQH